MRASRYRIQTLWMEWDPHNPQTLHVGSHIHSLQGDPSQTLHLGSHVHSLQADSLPDPELELTCPQSPG